MTVAIRRAMTWLLVLGATAYAQSRRVIGMPPPPRPAGRMLRVLGAQPARPTRIVKGAPYSADVTTETNQLLSDGNRIHVVSSERVYRDSEGRTRRETTLTALGAASGANAPQLAFIDDPVAGVRYTLDLTARTATKMPFRPPPARSGSPVDRVRRNQTNDPNTKIESLGRQTVAGVPADGTRITQTIPAGQIGNLLPIQIVTERWYSPDLQTVILQKRSDPRSGETLTQLTNIIRAEPSPTLFQPPAEFAVTEDAPRAPRVPGRP